MLSTGCAGSDVAQAAGTGVLMPAAVLHGGGGSSSKHMLPPRHSGMQAAHHFAMPTAAQHCLQQAAGPPAAPGWHPAPPAAVPSARCAHPAPAGQPMQCGTRVQRGRGMAGWHAASTLQWADHGWRAPKAALLKRP